jgi:hypothetical protein
MTNQGTNRGNCLGTSLITISLMMGSQGGTLNISQLIILTRVWEPKGVGTPDVPRLILTKKLRVTTRNMSHAGNISTLGNSQPNSIGTRPPMRSNTPFSWPGQQGIRQNRGEALEEAQEIQVGDDQMLILGICHSPLKAVRNSELLTSSRCYNWSGYGSSPPFLSALLSREGYR